MGLAYVLVPSTTENIEDKIKSLITPYYDYLPAKHEQEECSCVSTSAKGQRGHLKLVGQQTTRYPDPHCGTCHGTGVVTYSWNPEGRFEGYIIGDPEHLLLDAHKSASDWDDKVAVKDCISGDYEFVSAKARLNSLDMDRLKLPDVVVTPSGEWHESDVEWSLKDEDSPTWEKWRKTVHELYAAWPETILVVVTFE